MTEIKHSSTKNLDSLSITAHNLSSNEEGGFRDPYVRLSLHPEVDGRKRETAIHRGEEHPYFNEHFKWPVSRDQLNGRELVLQVFDYDRYSHNDIIGEVRIGLDELQLSKSVEVCCMSFGMRARLLHSESCVFFSPCAPDLGRFAAGQETGRGSAGNAGLAVVSGACRTHDHHIHQGAQFEHRA